MLLRGNSYPFNAVKKLEETTEEFMKSLLITTCFIIIFVKLSTVLTVLIYFFHFSRAIYEQKDKGIIQILYSFLRSVFE